MSKDQVIDLVVQQKLFSWSGGDFKVKDTSGKDYCVVQGKVMSMRDRPRRTCTTCAGVILSTPETNEKAPRTITSRSHEAVAMARWA